MMIRAINEERREYPMQALHSLALQANGGLQPEPISFGDNLATNTNTMAPAVFMRGGLAPRVARRVREYIDSNIEQRISVEALAKVANLSACYFVRAFKQSVGVTPHDYLIRQRVERTMKLLSGTDMPLSEIAIATGFADQSHFSRRFRQHVGMSPRHYRWSRP